MLYIGSTLVGNATHVVANVLTCNTLSPNSSDRRTRSLYNKLLPLAWSKLNHLTRARQHTQPAEASAPHTPQMSSVPESKDDDPSSSSCHCICNRACTDRQTSQQNVECTCHSLNGNIRQHDATHSDPGLPKPQLMCPYTGQPGGGHANGGYRPSPNTQLRTILQAGVYCEGQIGAHCGAHALAAMLGRQITSGPHYLVPLLTQWQREESLMQQYYQGQTYFSPSGMYTIQALNHWLDKMVEETVTLMPFLELGYRSPGAPRHNRASIMEAAPNGCEAIMIHYQHEYEREGETQKISHFKTWVQSAGTWYECESFQYQDCQRVRLVTEQDWEELHPHDEHDDSVNLLTLVRLDASTSGWTMRRAGDRRPTVMWTQLANKEWVLVSP